MPTVILGGPQEIERSQRIDTLTDRKLLNLTGQASLGESAAIVQEAALVIGVDTGLTHLGTAFGRPTIALLGATCPYLHTESRWTQVIYHPLACSPCKRKPTCEGRYDCMRAIRVDSVYTAARKLIEDATSHANENSAH